MWWRPFRHPLSGREASDPIVAGPEAGCTASDFERMVALLRSNERLFGTLDGVSQRLHEVRTYLAQDDCNVSLGRECYRYWRSRHSGVLTQLRANRLEARRVLRRLDATSLGYSGARSGWEVDT